MLIDPEYLVETIFVVGCGRHLRPLRVLLFLRVFGVWPCILSFLELA